MATELKPAQRTGRGIRRLVAGVAALGLALTGVLAAGPAFAAEPVAPISAEYAAEVPVAPVPIIEEEADALPLEPTPGVAESTTPALGLSIFLITAATAGAGGLAIARLAAAKRQTAEVMSHK